MKTGIIKSQHGSKLYVYKLTDKAAGQSKALKWWAWSIRRSMASFPIWRLLLWCWKPLEQTLLQPAFCECKDTFAIMALTNSLIQAYKHVFTLPSSAEKEAKATCSGNACLHGMTSVTPASIAYIATQVYSNWFCHTLYFTFLLQVHFALSCRSDTASDSESFYLSILELLNDVKELKEVNNLLVLGNQYDEINYPFSLFSWIYI